MSILIKEKTETIEDLSANGYRLIQSKHGYRFGEDTVLLADFVAHYLRGLPRNSKCIDLGAHSGASTLLLHARCPAFEITAVEIQSVPFDMLKRNIDINHLSEKIIPLNEDIRHIKANKLLAGSDFDLVFTNPPYFSPRCGILSPKKEMEEKNNARFEINGTLSDFVNAAAYALRPGGLFAMVYRVSRMAEAFAIIRTHKIEPVSLRFIHSKVDKPALHFLLAGRKGSYAGGLKVYPPLILRCRDGKMSSEYLKIYGEIE